MFNTRGRIQQAGALSSLMICAFLANAGSMGPVSASESGKFLLIEGGASYLHAFYKNNAVGAASYTVATPAGFSYNPSKIFANDFSGGYMSVSAYFNSLLLNARYEMFAMKGKRSFGGLVYEHKAPAKFAMTLDKTWECNTSLIYGVGAGAVLSTQNEAELFSYEPVGTTQIGYSFAGRTRIDPLVEALVMYKLTDKFNMRCNVSYQIPEHSSQTNGHLGVNLGINYAIPM